MKLSKEKTSFLVKEENDIVQAIARTEAIARRMGFQTNDTTLLKLVIEEACMNAYEYCQKTKQKQFKIHWITLPELLNISIKHKGEKFKIENPVEVNYGRRGRGLPLIKNLMDDVQVHKDGEYVELFMQKSLT